MAITFTFEHELNRGWIYDEDGEIMGEINFVVPTKWLGEVFDKYFSSVHNNIDVWLDTYVPEEDGEFIYQKAIEDNVLVKDLGSIYY